MLRMRPQIVAPLAALLLSTFAGQDATAADANDCSVLTRTQIVARLESDQAFQTWMRAPPQEAAFFGCARRFPQPVAGCWCGLTCPGYDREAAVTSYCAGAWRGNGRMQ
ncbi:MAG: hypothetical protein VX871_01970 [Pseudomonadota bacterium]|nr:hypothetical protein [Pseudomonadota bacterium]